MRSVLKHCIAIAALILLAAAVPAWAQRGRMGGGRAFGGARVAAGGFARQATPVRPSFGRFSSAPRFRPGYNGYRHSYYRNRGYFVPFWWGGTLCYLDTLEPYDYSCGGYPLGAYDYYGDYESYNEALPAYAYAAQPAYSYAPQPAPIIIQLPPSAPPQQQQAQLEAPLVRQPEAPGVQQPEARAPQREVLPFVLMRKDGRVIEAIGFTIAGGQVTYITPQGLRRSFPVAELDKDATRQWNEAQGTTVTLPG